MLILVVTNEQFQSVLESNCEDLFDLFDHPTTLKIGMDIIKKLVKNGTYYTVEDGYHLFAQGLRFNVSTQKALLSALGALADSRGTFYLVFITCVN